MKGYLGLIIFPIIMMINCSRLSNAFLVVRRGSSELKMCHHRRVASTIHYHQQANLHTYHHPLTVPRQHQSWGNAVTRRFSTTSNTKEDDDAVATTTAKDGTSDDSSKQPYIKSYQLNGVGTKSRVEITTNTDHKLATDVPIKMGGKNSAPQPVETLVAAWMGCTQATAMFVGRQMNPRLLIDKLVFENVQAERDERGALQLPIDENPIVPSRLQRITGTIQVYNRKKNERISNEQIELLMEQTELRCPVANMIIASGCSMDVKWIDGSIRTTTDNQ